MCRKRGGQKTVLMNVHPQTLTVVNYEHTVADRGVSGPWGPQLCGPSLCNGETQRLRAGGVGGPRRGPGQRPGGKRILATIYWKLAENQMTWPPSTPIIIFRSEKRRCSLWKSRYPSRLYEMCHLSGHQSYNYNVYSRLATNWVLWRRSPQHSQWFIKARSSILSSINCYCNTTNVYSDQGTACSLFALCPKQLFVDILGAPGALGPGPQWPRCWSATVNITIIVYNSWVSNWWLQTIEGDIY